jgi:hypothetical protein
MTRSGTIFARNMAALMNSTSFSLGTSRCSAEAIASGLLSMTSDGFVTVFIQPLFLLTKIDEKGRG